MASGKSAVSALCSRLAGWPIVLAMAAGCGMNPVGRVSWPESCGAPPSSSTSASGSSSAGSSTATPGGATASSGGSTAYSGGSNGSSGGASVAFDHPWSGNAEQQLRSLLASGLAGPDGSKGQAVIDKMNAMGGIYSGGEFQPHHDGNGPPCYGYGWFYACYVPLGNGQTGYQIVEFGNPPSGDK